MKTIIVIIIIFFIVLISYVGCEESVNAVGEGLGKFIGGAIMGIIAYFILKILFAKDV
tara:strand:+ start:2249 stop:2422 length:174 start_codon:yes stop_codon:yes gene_type:complete